MFVQKLEKKFRNKARSLLSRKLFRPFVEVLEDRLAPALLIVNEATDTNPQGGGKGTGNAGDLRYCITRANKTAAPDLIDFQINGAGPHTIALAADLPLIVNPLTIDGYSQRGASPNNKAIPDGDDAVLNIIINGTNKGDGLDRGLGINSDNVAIKGLVINGFLDPGIRVIGGTNIRIQGCFIGTDVTGIQAVPNGFGIAVINRANVLIGGSTLADRNLISGNSGVGIEVDSGNNKIFNNYIGVDATGQMERPNDGDGLWVSGDANQIGGLQAGQRNVISGNKGRGVLIEESKSNKVYNNYIGLNATGNAPIPNLASGVRIIDGSSNISSSNIIGGNTPNARNYISGNGGYGVEIYTSRG